MQTRPDAAVSDLEFGLFSGGRVRIRRSACADCATQACVKRCVSSTMDPVLKIESGFPVLAKPDARPETGWCVECLACELDCALYGLNAVRITFPED